MLSFSTAICFRHAANAARKLLSNVHSRPRIMSSAQMNTADRSVVLAHAPRWPCHWTLSTALSMYRRTADRLRQQSQTDAAAAAAVAVTSAERLAPFTTSVNCGYVVCCIISSLYIITGAQPGFYIEGIEAERRRARESGRQWY